MEWNFLWHGIPGINMKHLLLLIELQGPMRGLTGLWFLVMLYRHSYFGLKNSDNTNIKFYLLYNKYIDLLNTIIESKLDDKLQTLNTNYYKLNLEMSKYISCRDITPINKSLDTNFINYNNNYLDLIMIQPNNIFRLDNIINTKKANMIDV